MFRSTLVPVLALGFACVAHAQSSEDADRQALTQLLHEFMAGASRSDLAVHSRFWDEDLVYTSSSGERFGREDIIAGLTGARDPDENAPDITYLAENIRIKLYGDAAVVAFRLIGVTHDAEGEGRPRVENYYNTGTFIRRQDQWRAVAWQATRIPDD